MANLRFLRTLWANWYFTVRTRLELVISSVTGRCPNQLDQRTNLGSCTAIHKPRGRNLFWKWNFMFGDECNHQWRIAGLNRWPPACKAGALPAELIPHMWGYVNPTFLEKINDELNHIETIIYERQIDMFNNISQMSNSYLNWLIFMFINGYLPQPYYKE